MDRLEVGQKVGAKTYEKERDAEGKATAKDVPPRFVGKVVEVSPDGKSGFVNIELTEEQKTRARLTAIKMGGRGRANAILLDNERKFFHANELEEV
jgi:hypothetical protein